MTTTREDIILTLKFATENLENLRSKTKQFQRQVRELNREITAQSLKMNRTTSASWRTRFREQILGLKEQKLAVQRTADKTSDTTQTELGSQNKLKNQRDEMIAQSQRMSRQMKGVNKLMSGGAQKLINQVSAAKKLGVGYDSLGGSMRMPMERWKKFNQEGQRFDSIGGRMGNRLRMMTHGLRGFRMEMLGVMFFGMGMAEMFSSMFRPAMEMFGVFELWTTMLQLVFLPIMMALFPYFLDFFNFIINLPEPVKILIGIFAGLGFILGKFLFLFGMLALGIGSVIQAFGATSVMATFTTALEWITIAFAPFMIILGVVILAIAGFVSAWKTNFGGIKEWTAVFINGLKKHFGGIKKMVTGVIDIFKGLFMGDGALIVDGIKNILGGLKDAFTGLKEMLIGLLVIIGLSLLRVLTNIFKALWGFIKTGFVSILNWIIGKINDLIDSINSALGRFGRIGHIGTIGNDTTSQSSQIAQTNPFNASLTGMTPVIINQTNNINSTIKEDMLKMIEENDKKLVDTLNQQISAVGG